MKFKKLKKSVMLKVYTKTPTKWTLIDEESGQVYRGNKELANSPHNNGWEFKGRINVEVLYNATS